MTKRLAAAVAAISAVALLAACGGIDPTEAVESFNKDVNAKVQTGLSAAGVTGAAAADAGIDLKCPSDVEQEKPFTCTLTGKLSGKTVDVSMEINSSEELDTVDNSAFTRELDTLSVAEGEAAGKAAAK